MSKKAKTLTAAQKAQVSELIKLGQAPEAAEEAVRLGLTAAHFRSPAAAIEKAHADHNRARRAGGPTIVPPKGRKG